MNLVNENTIRLIIDHTTDPVSVVRLSEVSSFFHNIITTTLSYKAAIAIQRKSIFDPYRTLIDMCIKKENHAVKWLIETYSMTYEDIIHYDDNFLKYVSTNDNIELFRYIHERFSLTVEHLRRENNSIIKWSSLKGYINILQYILLNFSITSKDIALNESRAIRWAKSKECLDILSRCTVD